MRVDERAGAFWGWWTAGTTGMVGSAVGSGSTVGAAGR
jgi:hypothetical protein